MRPPRPGVCLEHLVPLTDTVCPLPVDTHDLACPVAGEASVETDNRYDGIGEDGVDDYATRVIRYKAWQLVGKAGFTESDRPDLEQELMLDLLKRLPKYDPRRATRSTFIKGIVDNCVARLIEARRACKRDHRREAWSLDDPIEGEGRSVPRGHTIDQETYWRRSRRCARPQAEREDLGMDLEDVLADLPPDLREVGRELSIRRIFEVAREIGISRQAVYLAIKKLRRRFADAGLKEYL